MRVNFIKVVIIWLFQNVGKIIIKLEGLKLAEEMNLGGFKSQKWGPIKKKKYQHLVISKIGKFKIKLAAKMI